ncbi:PrgI family protein [Peptoniphilaceae bacterium SGI.131]
MAFTEIPKDLLEIKKKVAFNLTLRQLVAVVITAIVCVPLYIFLKPLGDLRVYFTGTLALLIFLLLLYKKDGITLDRYMIYKIKRTKLNKINRHLIKRNNYDFNNVIKESGHFDHAKKG